MKKVLVIGGTSFVGRSIVESLMHANNYDITLFNRGVSNPNLFPCIKQVKGDRNKLSDVEKAFNQYWDIIIDVSCYYPKQLKHILDQDLAKLEKYIFISTCSVYDMEKITDSFNDEYAPVLSCSKSEEEDQSMFTYGKRKVACENLLINSGQPFVILRPPVVYGPYDPTDRFYYWMHQVKTKKKLILPQNGTKPISLVYSQDLAGIVENLIQIDIKNEVFNCVSSPRISINEIVAASEKVLAKSVNKLSASSEFLKEHKISQWADMPLWINSNYHTYSNEKLKQLLAYKPTPFEETVRVSHLYYEKLNYPQPKYGMTESRLNDLLAKLVNKKTRLK